MAEISILRTLDGAEIPAGKVHRAPLIGPPAGTTTTLPAWLVASNGTPTFPANPTDWGVQMTTGLVAGNQATLATNFTLAAADFRQIRWTVDAWRFDSEAIGATASISIRNAASTAGVTLFGLLSAGGTTLRVITPGPDTDFDLDYQFSDDEALRHRCLTLDLRPIDKRLYICEGDQVIDGGAIDLAGIFAEDEDATDLIAQVNLTNSTGGTARWWRAAQVRLDLTHN